MPLVLSQASCELRLLLPFCCIAVAVGGLSHMSDTLQIYVLWTVDTWTPFPQHVSLHSGVACQRQPMNVNLFEQLRRTHTRVCYVVSWRGLAGFSSAAGVMSSLNRNNFTTDRPLRSQPHAHVFSRETCRVPNMLQAHGRDSLP